MDMTRMAEDMSSAHEALLREREALTSLQARGRGLAGGPGRVGGSVLR
jgi:hypothetical protein